LRGARAGRTVPLLMRRLATLPLVLLAFTAGGVFTLAGGGRSAPRDGEPAVFAGLAERALVAGLPDGGFLVADRTSVWRVDRQGIIRPVAGTEEFGDSGDGGPALEAEFGADGLAALPGGGFLIADEDNHKVRMVAPDGTISTVAGGGRLKPRDGVLATQADAGYPLSVAPLPGGGFAFVDDDTLREVEPDGRLRTVRVPGTRVTAVAAAPGGLLVGVDYARVLRLAPDATLTPAARAPAGEHVNVNQIAATADGGFVLTDDSIDSATMDHTRVWRVAPDGAMWVIAGGGPFAATAPNGLVQDAAGQPAIRSEFGRPRAIAVAPDGGVLIGEDENGAAPLPDLVRYIAPHAPQLLGVALVRDRDRVFGPGRANAVHVSLTRPATVTLTVAGHSTTAALGAGESRLPLPRGLSRQPQTVTLTAADAAGDRAYDRTRIFPQRWLPEETAQLVAYALDLGDNVDDCRRFGRRRVDCQIFKDVACSAMASVSLVRDRLRWGTYPCSRGGRIFRPRPRYSRQPRPLRPADWRQCVSGCPPALFGRVDEAALIPSG
jgi:hypothetical protein